MCDAGQISHARGAPLRPSLTESGASSAPQDSQKLSVAPTDSPQSRHAPDAAMALARMAPDEAQRIVLVDRANEVRPRTWL